MTTLAAIKKYVWITGPIMLNMNAAIELFNVTLTTAQLLAQLTVTTHSIQCPLHCVWCAGCKMNWTVLATDHNCNKTKEFARLTNKTIYHRQCSEPADGSLYIPFGSYNKVSFDIFTLKKVHDLILNYRSAEAVSCMVAYPNSSTLPFRVTRSQNLIHINEDTQFPN